MPIGGRMMWSDPPNRRRLDMTKDISHRPMPIGGRMMWSDPPNRRRLGF